MVSRLLIQIHRVMSSQNRYYNEYHEGLVEILKIFLNSLLNQIVDKTMVAAVKEK